jgi:hypothetical protein
MRHLSLAIIACAWLAGCVSVPEVKREVPASTLDVTFAEFDKVIETADSLVFSDYVANVCDRGFTAYFTIRAVATKSPAQPIPMRYVHSLKYDLYTLGQVAKSDNLTPAQEDVITYAVLNLETKAAQAVASPSRWADLVDTTVETVRDDKPVANLQVWYCPRGWASVAPRWQRFAALSTPTTEKLPPGIYLVAAKSPNVNPVPMRVGGNGEGSVRFVLQVP